MSEVSPHFLELQESLAGRYSLERELDRTSATIRFLARDVRLDRPVEIELLDPEQAGRADVRERFLAGARAAAGLFHPHIVPVHGVEESGGLACLIATPELSTACEESPPENSSEPVVENSAETHDGRTNTHRFRYERICPSRGRIARDLRAEAVRFGPKRTLQMVTRQGLDL